MPKPTTGDIVESFYYEVINSQLIEFKLADAETTPQATQQVEAARRRLGRALSRLLSAFIPEERRTPRLFRAKYTDELNLDLLEDWLISAANRVFDLANGDNSLRPVKPMAKDFLDILARVQTTVSTSMEESGKIVYHSDILEPHPTEDHARRISPASSGIHENENSHIRVRSTPSAIMDHDEQTSLANDMSNQAFVNEAAHDLVSTTLSATVAGGSLLHLSESDPHLRCADIPIAQPTSSCSGNLTRATLKPTLPVNFRLPEMFSSLLMELDNSMAVFEFALVSAVSRRMRTITEVGEVHDVAILFSETIMWALAVGLIDATKLSDRDPLLLVSLPRLAVFVGCYVLPHGPIGHHHLSSGCKPPFMFADSVKELSYLGRQLAVLRADQLWRLACWLSPYGLSDSESRSVSTATSRILPTKPSKLDLNPLRRLAVNELDSTTIQDQSNFPHKRGRLVTWSTSALHSIYKCISNVAGLFTTNFPTEYRDILQLAIEINDPGEDTCSVTKAETIETTDDGLLPLSPISFITIGLEADPSDVSSENDIEKRLGFIKGVNLKHVFDWNRVLFGPERPCCDLLFEYRHLVDSEKKNSLRPSDQPYVIKSANISRKISLSDMFSKSFDEIGIDVAASMNIEDDPDPLKESPVDKSHRRRPFAWSLLSHSTIEGVSSEVPDSAYPLPQWQPDHPPYTNLISANRTVPTVPSRDQSDDEDDADPENSSSKPANQWKAPPISGKECVGCKSTFNLIRRRHHCRRCGHIYCGACCSYWAPVESLRSLQPVRVCRECAEFVQRSLDDILNEDLSLVMPNML